MGRFGRADVDTPHRGAAGRDNSSSHSAHDLSRRTRIGPPVGCSNGEQWTEGKAPDRRCRCRGRRMAGPGHPLPARLDCGSSVGCAARSHRRDAGRHAAYWLVPIAPLCAARPGDGTDRRCCRGGRRDPRVAPWRWEPQLSRRDPCRRVLRSCSGGLPLDVLSVVACTAGAGSLSPRTRHGRDQRRCRCRLEHAALTARARIRSAGDHRGAPRVIRTGITCPAALLSTSFQRWRGKPTPTGFCWWPMHSRQRSFTGLSRSGRQTDCTSRSGRVSGDWERVAFAVFQ